MGHAYDNGSKAAEDNTLGQGRLPAAPDCTAKIGDDSHQMHGELHELAQEAIGFAVRLPVRIKDLIDGWADETGRPDIARRMLHAKYIALDDRRALELSNDLTGQNPSLTDPLGAFLEEAIAEVRIHYAQARLPRPQDPSSVVVKTIQNIPGVLAGR